MVNPILQKTLDWLDAGAPHTHFDIRLPFRELNPGTIEVYDLHPAPDCGTVCCIAGYMVQQGNPELVTQDWQIIQAEALNLLGLPDRGTDDSNLPVFDPDRAPDRATPAQAAAALRRWADHDFTYSQRFDPWT